MIDTELADLASGSGATGISYNAICVDGAKVEIDICKIDGNNYLRLFGLVRALNFYVG